MMAVATCLSGYLTWAEEPTDRETDEILNRAHGLVLYVNGLAEVSDEKLASWKGEIRIRNDESFHTNALIRAEIQFERNESRYWWQYCMDECRMRSAYIWKVTY